MELNLTKEQEERLKGIHMTEESKIRIVTHLIKSHKELSEKMDKYRGCSPLTDGWQTSRFAKKSRSWDEMAKKLSVIRQVLYDDWNVEI